MTCAHDLTTGSGLWQPMHSTICPAEGCGTTGIVKSPNYPKNYPNNLHKTETIQVEDGLILSLQFTAFDIEVQYDLSINGMDYSSFTCPYDHLTITDGDGTILMERRCGLSSLLPAITSKSNAINLVFSTNGVNTENGWSVSWIAVTPGKLCRRCLGNLSRKRLTNQRENAKHCQRQNRLHFI